MVGAADQAQVVQLRRAAICPVDQMMPIAPGRGPVATGEDAVMIPRHQRPTGGGWNAATGMGDFQLELAKPGDSGDG